MTNDSLLHTTTKVSETHHSLQYCSDGATYHIFMTAEFDKGYWNIAYAINGVWTAVEVLSERRNIHTKADALCLALMWAESKIYRLRVSDMMRFPQSVSDRQHVICYLLSKDPVLKTKVYAVYPSYVNPYIKIVANKNELGDIARTIKPYAKGIEIDYLPKESN